MAATAPRRGGVPAAPATPAIGAVGWALTGFAAFATVDALVKLLAGGLPVMQIAFFLALFSTGPVAFVLWREGGLGGLRTAVPHLVALRAALVSGASLCAWSAFARLPLADAYALIFTVPLWVTVLSVPVLGERVRWRRAAAVGVGFVGVLVMLRPGSAPLEAGHGFAAAAALCAASAMLTTRVIGRRAGGGLQLGVLALLMIAITAPAVAAAPPALDAATLALLALAGLMTGLAQFGLWTALQQGSASIVSPFQYSQLLWATFYGLVLFGAVPDPMTLAGAALVIGSGLYVMHRERALRRAESA